MNLTLEQWQHATGADEEHAAAYYVPALAAMERYRIEEPRAVAAFCATLSIESMRLTQMEEGLYYKDPARLVKIYPRAFKTVAQAQPYARNPKGLSQLLYKGYHGRGGIQLTWERNYRIHSQRTGFDYLGHPHLLLEPEHAMLSAASFWDLNNINDVAYDMGEVTLRVNGPARLHLAERIAQYEAAMEVFG